jgi:hypothetical protein
MLPNVSFVIGRKTIKKRTLKQLQAVKMELRSDAPPFLVHSPVPVDLRGRMSGLEAKVSQTFLQRERRLLAHPGRQGRRPARPVAGVHLPRRGHG